MTDETPVQYFLRTAARGTIVVKHKDAEQKLNIITVGKIISYSTASLRLRYTSNPKSDTIRIKLEDILHIRVLRFSHLHGEFKV